MKDLTKLLTGNKMATIIVSMLIVLYSALAAPALPNSVILFFDTWYGKLLFMFLIGFVASHNVQVALVIAILFFVILNMATKLEVEKFMGQREGFEEQKETEKSPDLSTNMTDMLKSVLCVIVKDDTMVDMKMNTRDYASKNMDKLLKSLNITKEALNSLLENMPNSKLEEICVEKNEGFEENTENFYNKEVLVVNPADPLEEVGAPVDF